MNADEMRAEILSRIPAYFCENWPEEEFVPGVSRVRIGARVFGAHEIVYLVDAALDFWLTADRYATKFEKALQSFLGVREALLCNSGSSANLLAISALTSKELPDTRLNPGDEVITVAAGFPTTVNGIFQNGLVPVFVDIEPETYNVDTSLLEEAYSERTRAVMLAHTLGHPFDVKGVRDFCDRHRLWLIEDNCDALGSKYDGRYTGTFGDMATQSFFPAHHITMGQGGAVVTRSPLLACIVRSFRDWGRDCWCDAGKENTCGKRYNWQKGDLPYGYDHKYTYSHVGYNLSITDLQAAIGCAQIERLPGFIKERKRNWLRLRAGLDDLQEFFVLPQARPNCDPSWFGFALRVRPEAPFNRLDVILNLAVHRIDTRLLFAGNLAKQPAYHGLNFRVPGKVLPNTDDAMLNAFWLGVYPGLNDKALDYVIEVLHDFVKMPHGQA